MLWNTIRHTFRSMRKNLGITLLTITSLALAVAGNSIVFSIMNGLLYRPLPYPEPHRLALLSERAKDLPGGQVLPSSPVNFLDWEDRQTSFSELAAYRVASFSLDHGDEQPEQLTGASVTPDFFTVLGAQPVFGRAFLEDEGVPGRDRSVLLGYAFWAEKYGASPDVIGEVLKLNGTSYTVVGIMPEDFEFLIPQTAIYTPLALDRERLERHQRSVLVVGRLASGVSDGDAKSEMAAIMAQLEEQYPQANRSYVVDVLNLREEIPDSRNRLFFLMIQGALLFVLLIACANIANLLLARSQAREREIAIRSSLGAGRRSIIRQLLVENMVMAALAGAIGLTLASFGIRVVSSILAGFMPRFYLPVLDANVFLFTLAVTLLGGALFGLAPILQTFRYDLLGALKDGTQASSAGGRRRFVANTLVVAEIAFALIFLGGAGVLLRSFDLMQSSDPGFETANLLTVRISLPRNTYPDAAERWQAIDSVDERLAAIPGIEASTVSSITPRSPFASPEIFVVDDSPPGPDQPSPRAMWLTASTSFFETLEIPLRSGRVFTDADHLDATPVVVINESMASRFWGEASPLGEHITAQGKSREIVGIVADARHGLAIADDFSPTLYIPVAQQPTPGVIFSLRGAEGIEVGSLGQQVRDEIRAFDPNLSIPQVQTLEAFVDQFWVGQKLFSTILGGFGILALVLAAVGTYGVLAYAVAQRRHEIGVRMSLGANRAKVTSMVVRQGMTLAAIGIGIGLLGMYWVNKGLQAILSDFVPVELGRIGVVALVLAIVALFASLLPARRAASVDPLVALRIE